MPYGRGGFVSTILSTDHQREQMINFWQRILDVGSMQDLGSIPIGDPPPGVKIGRLVLVPAIIRNTPEQFLLSALRKRIGVCTSPDVFKYPQEWQRHPQHGSYAVWVEDADEAKWHEPLPAKYFTSSGQFMTTLAEELILQLFSIEVLGRRMSAEVICYCAGSTRLRPMKDQKEPVLEVPVVDRRTRDLLVHWYDASLVPQARRYGVRRVFLAS